MNELETSIKSAKFDKADYISLTDAAEHCQYSQEYLSLRARQGKLRAVKRGRNWVTTLGWLQDYLAQVDEAKTELKLATAVTVAKNHQSELASPKSVLPESVNSEPIKQEEVAQITLEATPQPVIEPVVDPELSFHPSALRKTSSSRANRIDSEDLAGRFVDRLEFEPIVPNGQSFSWDNSEVAPKVIHEDHYERAFQDSVQAEVERILQADDPLMDIDLSQFPNEDQALIKRILMGSQGDADPTSQSPHQSIRISQLSRSQIQDSDQSHTKTTQSRKSDFWQSFNQEGQALSTQIMAVVRPMAMVTTVFLLFTAFFLFNGPYRITQKIASGASTVGQSLAGQFVVGADSNTNQAVIEKVNPERVAQFDIENETIDLDLEDSIALTNRSSGIVSASGRVAGATDQQPVAEMSGFALVLHRIGVGIRVVADSLLGS